MHSPGRGYGLVLARAIRCWSAARSSVNSALEQRCSHVASRPPPWRDPRRTEGARLSSALGGWRWSADPAASRRGGSPCRRIRCLPRPVGEGLIGCEMSSGEESVDFGLGGPPGFLCELLEPLRLKDALLRLVLATHRARRIVQKAFEKPPPQLRDHVPASGPPGEPVRRPSSS